MEFRHFLEQHWVESTKIPPEPGTIPLPSGYVRVFHYTKPGTEEGEGDLLCHQMAERIRKQGININFSRGESYGEPKVVWVSATKPHNGKVFAEMFIKIDDPRWGPHWRNKGPSTNGDAYLVDSIRPEEIIAVHEPWHTKYHYIKNNPEVERQVLDGEFDHLLDREEYGPAIRAIKLAI